MTPGTSCNGDVVNLEGGGRYVLNGFRWGWSTNPASGDYTGLAGPENGRMLVDFHNYIGFRAPAGAVSVTFSATMYYNVYETGFFGIGSQPHPSGESVLPWELWVSYYNGEQTTNPGHDVVASGVLPDYSYKDGIDPVDEFFGQSVSFTIPVVGGQIFQIGGRYPTTTTR